MPEKDLQCTLNAILAKLNESNGRCAYHEELHSKVQKALSETQILRVDISTIKDSVAGIRNDIKERLNKGDSSFVDIRKEMKDLSEKLTKLDTAMGTGFKFSDKAANIILTIIIIIIMAVQALLYILNK